MGRLRQETLDRMETYADRVLDVADALERQRRSRRLIEQATDSGTSAGANAFEADEAPTSRDFAKTMGIVLKELNETRFWLRVFVRRGWIRASRMNPLIEETITLKAMFGAMVVRTRRAIESAPRRKRRGQAVT